MRKPLLLVASVGLVVALDLSPAAAITGGGPDGSTHPNVGALLGRDGPTGPYFFVCSGSLLADDVFLTTAHCVTWEQVGQTTENVFVSFDPDLQAANPLDWGSFGPIVRPDHVIALNPVHPRDSMPGYWLPPSGALSRNDVAVLYLAVEASSVYPDIEPIDLPDAGLLRTAAANGSLTATSFTNVGYGFQSISFVNPTTPVAFDGRRMTSTSPFGGLTKDHLLTLENGNATGEGGVCMGDSGGPNFLGDVVVGLNVGQGYHGCDIGNNASQRLDLPAVLEFLGPFAD